MLNLPADETDQFARGSTTAGDFDEPLDLQRRSHDAHQDRRRRTRCWYRGGGLRHLGTHQFGRRIYPDRARHEGRQGRDDHEFRDIHGPLTKEFRNSRGLFSSPPKSLRGYVEDPTTPSRLPKTPAPHGRFLFVRLAEAGDTTSACHRTLNRIRFS